MNIRASTKEYGGWHKDCDGISLTYHRAGSGHLSYRGLTLVADLLPLRLLFRLQRCTLVVD